MRMWSDLVSTVILLMFQQKYKDIFFSIFLLIVEETQNEETITQFNHILY